MIERRTSYVLGSPIDALTWEATIDTIRSWAQSRQSRVVCICNVHSVVTARRDAEFAKAIRGADLATPDGFPVALMLRAQGRTGQERINGPDLMSRYCAQAASGGESVYLFGSREDTLLALQRVLVEQYPGLIIAGMHSPPFREPTAAEDAAIVEEINASGAGTVWVGLGCPKQEKWMSAHRGHINAVMIGVGAAFDYHAGTLQRAPLWMQRNGFEWLYRFLKEPRRLGRRYLVTNTLFLWYAGMQLFRRGFGLSEDIS